MIERIITYNLFLDDIRDPPDNTFVVARSSEHAITLIKMVGYPVFMSLDHDLSGEDTTMVFLKWLSDHYYDADIKYVVHSSNPCGVKNIVSFMESWKKSKRL